MNAIFPLHYVMKLEFQIFHRNNILISFELCIAWQISAGPNELYFIDRFFPVDFVILNVSVSNKFIGFFRSFR